MSSRRPDKPNIVCMLSDDQGSWALGCYGNKEISTPHLDRLSSEGIHFTNFYCTSPVCSPARASLLTGRIPSQHGVHDWIREGNCGENGRSYLDGLDAYTDYLRENGYVCGLSGKWHLGNSQIVQKGFSHWYAHQKGGGNYYGAPMIRDGKPVVETEYITDLITDDALTFIEKQAKTDAPFYLSLHYTAPHSPWLNQHPQRFVSLYDDCPFNSVPREKPHPWNLFVKVPDAIPESIWENPTEHLKGYYGAISAMDWNIGRVVDRIKSLGLEENTLFIFLSDNGFNCGHHGIWGKGNGTYPQNMYDTSVKIPAIFRHIGNIPEGITSETMLSGYDFMPTLLSYVGIPYEDESKPGRDFSGVLLGNGRHASEHESVVVYDEYGPVRMIRNREWKYVHRYPNGPNELYHVCVDAGERRNLVADSSCASVKEELQGSLESWFTRYEDSDRSGIGEHVTGKGQIDLVGVRGSGRKAFYDGE